MRHALAALTQFVLGHVADIGCDRLLSPSRPKTTANDMRQATDDLGAMEKYIAELGEKCQATWSQLDEATCVHLALPPSFLLLTAQQGCFAPAHA